jgi:hypothetical protein
VHDRAAGGRGQAEGCEYKLPTSSVYKSETRGELSRTFAWGNEASSPRFRLLFPPPAGLYLYIMYSKVRCRLLSKSFLRSAILVRGADYTVLVSSLLFFILI